MREENQIRMRVNEREIGKEVGRKKERTREWG